MATLPIGYEDSIPRALSTKGTVQRGGEKAPIIGRICMD
ncbi:alanine racemase C-terminal domain-containing protein [Metabacillus sp. HB246100]